MRVIVCNDCQLIVKNHLYQAKIQKNPSD